MRARAAEKPSEAGSHQQRGRVRMRKTFLAESRGEVMLNDAQREESEGRDVAGRTPWGG